MLPEERRGRRLPAVTNEPAPHRRFIELWQLPILAPPVALLIWAALYIPPHWAAVFRDAFTPHRLMWIGAMCVLAVVRGLFIRLMRLICPEKLVLGIDECRDLGWAHDAPDGPQRIENGARPTLLIGGPDQ